MTTSAATMKRTALLRAAIIAHFNSPDVTAPQSVRDVLIAVGSKISGFRPKYNQVYLALKGMARNGQLYANDVEGPGTKTEYTRASQAVQAEVAPKAVRGKNKPKAVAADGKEVELVIAGVTIIVSTNPVTGRPRVVIE